MMNTRFLSALAASCALLVAIPALAIGQEANFVFRPKPHIIGTANAPQEPEGPQEPDDPHGSMSISLSNESFMAGQAVDYLPEISGTTPDTIFAFDYDPALPWPVGLAIDTATGQISGMMPFGTYRGIRVKATNPSATSESDYVTWIGRSDETLAFLFEPVLDAEPDTVVMSEIVPVTGIESPTNTFVISNGGVGSHDFRICYDSGCLDEKTTWTDESGTVSNGEFIQLRTVVPSGSEERNLSLWVGGQSGDWTVSPAGELLARDFKQVALGSNFSCGLKTDGSAWCWGAQADGSLGNGSSNGSAVTHPIPVAGEHVFKKLSAGNRHICGLKNNGSLWCWGNGANGKLGNGSTITKNVPSEVIGGHAFVDVAASSTNTCAIKADGTAYCWGSNIFGQIGNGKKDSVNYTSPTKAGGAGFVDIEMANATVCTLKADGSAWCWGLNQGGQMGDGTIVDKLTPTAVFGGHVFEKITSGGQQTCGLTAAKEAWCWGIAGQGQLGNGSNGQSSKPVQVSGGHAFESIALSQSHSCGIDEEGTAWCWGKGDAGALGNGDVSNSSVPVQVSGGHAFMDINNGVFGHTCGVEVGGSVLCWGASGALGIGDGNDSSVLTPTYVVE